MQENIKVRIQKSKYSRNALQEMKKRPQSLLYPNVIPQNQIEKFSTTLQFLKQKPLQNFLQEEFIAKIKKEAFVNEIELNSLLCSLKVDKQLLIVLTEYFQICFKHKQQSNNQTKEQYDSNELDEIYRTNTKNIPESNEVDLQKLHNRLIILSSYETLTALMFLKNVFQQKFVHKKLINELQKNDITKKLQILVDPNLRKNQRSRSLKRKIKKQTIYFNPNTLQNNFVEQKPQQQESKNGRVFAIIKAKIFTISFLQYEKLENKQKLFHSHLKLLQDCINSRQVILNQLISDIMKYQSQQFFQFILDYQNSTSYFVLKLFELKIQFQPEDREYLILKEIKQRKKSAKNLIDLLEVKKTPKIQFFVNSIKIYLKCLEKLNDDIKKRVAIQLLGIDPRDSQNVDYQKLKSPLGLNDSQVSEQFRKKSIYQLTVNALTKQNKKNPNRAKSNDKILEQYIRNHDETKLKKQADAKNLRKHAQAQSLEKNKSRSVSRFQIHKARSLTVLRQNLHKNIFMQEQNLKQKNKDSKNSSSIGKRSRSVFNLSKKKDQNESSIKTLLQSPLTRQIQIYLEYQKFLKNSKNPPDDKLTLKQFAKSTQSRVLNQDSKTNVDGFRLIDQINKYNIQPNKQKKLLTSSKKKKIHTIYKAFAYNNKIIDISHWKLEEEIKQSTKNYFYNKKVVSTQLTEPICKFGAGIRDLNSALDELLAERCYMGIHYVKFWQSKIFFYKIRLSQQEDKFSLHMKMNNNIINMILPRGNNILCERYHTIWPTIRYLFQKKIFQFSMIKFFEHIFLQKKNSKFQLSKDPTKDSLKDNQGFSAKDSIIMSKDNSDIYKNQQFDQNQCSVYESTFGQVESDEVQELNSCFDYIHKFMGLIFSVIRKQNGRKEIIWPLQDNSTIKDFAQIHALGESKKDQFMNLNDTKIKQHYLWRRVAKYWVTLQKREQVHLFSYVSKMNGQHFYLFSVVLQKEQTIKLSETFMAYSVYHDNLTQKEKHELRKKYWDVQLKFKIYWRPNNKLITSNTKKQVFSTINVSFERLSLYNVDMKFMAQIIMNIINDNVYNPKLNENLKILVQNALYIQSSIQGERLYDVYGPSKQKLKNFFLINHQKTTFKDYYKSRSNQNQLQASINDTNSQNILFKSNLQHFDHKDDSNLLLMNFGTTKNQIHIIENFLDILTWHNGDNQVRFKPNSKWKIVQKKIHTMITFVTHLSKKTQRKSSLLTTQKIRQNHQFIEQISGESKKGQKVSPLMMKSLPKMKKSIINFLEKIQNQLYRIKVTIIQSTNTMSEQTDLSKKWMAECILIKENSKQYNKFYISSADTEAIFHLQVEKDLANESSSFSESYDLFNSRKQSNMKRKRNSSNRERHSSNLKSTLRKRSSEFSQENINESSIRETNPREIEPNYDSSHKRDKGLSFRYDCNGNIPKDAQDSSWQSFQFYSPDGHSRQIKQKRVKMFRKIIKAISFTKIKCFSKIVISKSLGQFQSSGQKFIAQPRNSLQILHQNTENPDKIFDLKYFTPLQNCYQTIICKPIRLSYKNKTDYVIITLFKIELKGNQKIYQFRINLNKNETYYACEITQQELRQLIDFSEKEKIRQNTSITIKNDNNTFLDGLMQIHTEVKQEEQVKDKEQQGKDNLDKYRSSLINTSSQILMEDIQNGKVFQKKKSVLKKPSTRASNFLNVQRCSAILPASRLSIGSKTNNQSYNSLLLTMVGKLEEYSKEILENIFKKIQVTVKSTESNEVNIGPQNDKLFLQVPKAKFRKELKLRVLQRISRNKDSIYLIEINERSIRELNQIVLKISMNNNFDIFRQNIFKNLVENQKKKHEEETNNLILKQGQSFMEIQAPERPMHIRRHEFDGQSKVRSSTHQSQISLLFSSFSLYQLKNNNEVKIKQMNDQSVIENISYEVEKKYGKQILLKFNSKKIKSYAEIFLSYYLKYVHVEERNDREKQ